jgi:hypothetical protein
LIDVHLHATTQRAACHFFLTSKPYSYSSEISQALVFYLALARQKIPADIGMVALQCLVMWLFFNWQSDRIQKDKGRFVPPLLLVLVPLGIALAIGYAAGGIYGVGGVLAHAFTIQTYSLKARHSLVGPFGPLLRSITVVGQFLRVWGFLGLQSPSTLTFYALAALAVWNGCRNLVGDVRDVRTDVNELPARWGIGFARWVIRFCNSMVLILCLVGNLPGRKGALVTVTLSWLILEVLAYRFGDAEAYKWGYLGHRILVVASVMLHLSLAQPLGLSWTWITILLLATVGFQPCYYLLPGKRFPNWGQLWLPGIL